MILSTNLIPINLIKIILKVISFKNFVLQMRKLNPREVKLFKIRNSVADGELRPLCSISLGDFSYRKSPLLPVNY